MILNHPKEEPKYGEQRNQIVLLFFPTYLWIMNNTFPETTSHDLPREGVPSLALAAVS